LPCGNAQRMLRWLGCKADECKRRLFADAGSRAPLNVANGKDSLPRGAAQLLGLKPAMLASRIKSVGVPPGMKD
jgi:hypothetical protein